MWHVSSRSGVVTLQTSIHLLLTYCLRYFIASFTIFTLPFYRPHMQWALPMHALTFCGLSVLVITVSHSEWLNGKRADLEYGLICSQETVH